MVFSCTAREAADHVVLVLAGDVDLAAADRLWSEVEPWLSMSPRVVVDCASVTFLDSVGLRTLLRIAQRAQETHTGLTLAAPSEPVARVLELAGTEDLFTDAPPASDPAA